MTSVTAQQGFNAFMDGKTQADNPFDNPHLRFRWESGWLDAREEIEFLMAHWKCDKAFAIRKLLNGGVSAI